MGTFVFLLRRSSGGVVLAVVFGVLSGLASAALIPFIHSWLSGTLPVTDPRILGGAFAALCLLVPATRVASQYFMQLVGQRTVRDLRLDLSSKIMASPLRQIETLGSSKLLTVLTTDIATISGTIVFIPVIFINAAVVLGCMAYLAYLSWPVFLMLLGVMAVGGITYRLPLNAGYRRFVSSRLVQEELFEYFRGVLGGIKELKLHRRRRQALLQGMETSANSQVRLNVVANAIFSGASGWGFLLFFVVIGLLLLLAPRSELLSTTGLTGYILVLLFMMTPLQVLLDSLPRFGQANVALQRIDELGLSLEEHREASDEGPALGALFGTDGASPAVNRLELRGATYRYRRQGEASDFVLGPVDLELVPGEVVFLIGGNGSGKTTLAKGLVGLYPPQEGAVVWNGREVEGELWHAYRESFSVVFSDFYLFQKLLGLEAPDLDDRARDYLSELRLDDIVTVEAGELSTTSLSTGQRKRLALLAAYLEDRPIYLFDEWAADQDPEFKQVFYHHILPDLQRRGKLLLAISHDDQYYDVADRLIKLADGQVVYDGPASSYVGLMPQRQAPEGIPAQT